MQEVRLKITNKNTMKIQGKNSLSKPSCAKRRNDLTIRRINTLHLKKVSVFDQAALLGREHNSSKGKSS